MKNITKGSPSAPLQKRGELMKYSLLTNRHFSFPLKFPQNSSIFIKSLTHRIYNPRIKP